MFISKENFLNYRGLKLSLHEYYRLLDNKNVIEFDRSYDDHHKVFHCWLKHAEDAIIVVRVTVKRYSDIAY